MSLLSKLSKRETVVLRYVAQGLNENEIGERCNISRTTVHTHKQRIFKALQIHNNVDATHFALFYKLIELKQFD